MKDSRSVQKCFDRSRKSSPTLYPSPLTTAPKTDLMLSRSVGERLLTMPANTKSDEDRSNPRMEGGMNNLTWIQNHQLVGSGVLKFTVSDKDVTRMQVRVHKIVREYLKFI